MCVYIVFKVFSLVVPTASKFLNWPLLKHLSHGVFISKIEFGDLGKTPALMQTYNASLSENETKSIIYGKICVKCDSKRYRMSLTNEACPR